MSAKRIIKANQSAQRMAILMTKDEYERSNKNRDFIFEGLTHAELVLTYPHQSKSPCVLRSPGQLSCSHVSPRHR